MIRKGLAINKSVLIIGTSVWLFFGLFKPTLHAVPIFQPEEEAVITKDSPVHQKAVEYLKKNSFDQVIEIERRNLKENPSDLKSYLLLSLAYLGKDDEKNALAQVEYVEKKDPRYAAELYGNMGRFYLIKKRYYKALHYFHNALRIDEKPAVLNQVGSIYLAQGRLIKAKAYFQKTVDTEPDFLNLSRICLAEKDYPGTVRYANQAVKQKSDMVEGHMLLGTAYLLSDNLEPAESIFLKAKKVDPKLVLADYNLGLIHLVQKKYDRALQNFSQIVQLAPKIKEAHISKAAILHIKGELDRAKNDANRAIDSDPADFLGHLVLGNIHLSEKNFGAADKAYRHCGNLFTEFTLPWFSTKANINLNSSGEAAGFTLANIYHRNGLFRQEIAAIHESLKGPSGKNVFMLMMEARAEAKLGNFDGAVKLYTLAMGLESKLITPYMELGNLAVQKGEPREAVNYYEKASKIAPDLSGLYFLLGDLYLSLDDSKKAVLYYQTGLKYAPESSFGHNQLAWVLAEKEMQYKTALTYARKAHELNPADAGIGDTLGWIYYRLKEYKDADAIYNEIEKGVIKNPIIFYHKGLVNQKLKKNREAIAAFESALDITDEFPEGSDAQKRLKQLSKL